MYQGGVKFTVSWVFEDLKFKISEGYDQNWCFPDCAQLAQFLNSTFNRNLRVPIIIVCPKTNQPWMIIIIPAKIKETDNIVPWEFSKRVSFHIALILIKVRCCPNKCQFTWLSSFFNRRNSIPVKISPVAIGWVHVKLSELISKRWGLQNVKTRL